MNLEKLNRIAGLEDGWDLYKATSFSNSSNPQSDS